MNILFPVFAVERRNFNRCDRRPVKAIRIDADPVRVATRHVKGLDTALSAEIMLRHSGIESIRFHVVLAAD